ncbi:MAG: cobalamin B12-binding domain-containing protein [Pseudomonadota bacterium]
MTDTREGYRAPPKAPDMDDLGASSFETLGARLGEVCGDGHPTNTLLRTLEGEVLPRLMLAHQGGLVGQTGFQHISQDVIESFVDILLYESADTATRFVEDLVSGGIAIESIFTQLMGPTAQRLGALWESDHCTFADVTIGLCRLHELLRRNSVVGDDTFRGAGAANKSVLLAAACGDQHVFGLLMVAEFFRRDGWRVWSEPGAVLSELEQLIAREPFDLLGLSITRTNSASRVREEIETLRKASINRDLKVIVGGDLLTRDPDIVERIGADGVAFDATSAPNAGRTLLARAN